MTHLRSRRWKLAASGLASGFVALAGAGLALKPAAPGSKNPNLRCPNAGAKQCPADTRVVSCSLERRRRLAQKRQRAARSYASRQHASRNQRSGIDTKSVGGNRRATAWRRAQRVAVPTAADTPALASAAAGSASKALQAAGLEPVPSGLGRPDGTPIAKISTTSADLTSPSETPRLHTEAATTAGIKAESAKPPAKKIELSATPNTGKSR